MTLNDLQGFWVLKDWQKEVKDHYRKPYSETEISGFLCYGSDSRMAVSLYETSTGQLISTYGGAYEFDGEKASHFPIEGYSPAGVREKKVRYLKVEGDRLDMSTPWLDGEEGPSRYLLTWQRAYH